MSAGGKKVVCGGTAANIVARETGLKIKTFLDFIDPEVPPIGMIRGIDLVTEGVLTLGKTVQILNGVRARNSEMFKRIRAGKDGASLLADFLVNRCTHLDLLVGRSINPAHQNPGLPKNLSIKLKLINEFGYLLSSMGKVVTVEYF